MRRSSASILILAALPALACATAGGVPASGSSSVGPVRVGVLTPRDGVPVRSRDAWPGDPATTPVAAAREQALRELRDDFAAALRARSVEATPIDAPPPSAKKVDPQAIAALGRVAGVDEVLFTELVAYGDIRRSWLWVLGAQGLAAGVGHGVVVAAATGRAALGWYAGGAEFLLETATWVGGAWLGSRAVDPVLIRSWLVRSRDGVVLKRWTREGLRPFPQWFRRRGLPPRAARLRAVADRAFEKLAPKIARRARLAISER
ncbi:MAG: hypothetical protein U0X73_18690 [Thermoanaerobaculia bacterium]